ncbi:carboxypeptidase regulatory-like domain-containing protein [Rufibacter sediminis]|uniref:Carboxypeptidase-like regulatory domain-containing protein n=1 Tax=Rufibacter sediminis TaxID=2762756 RepID=A0ABR6VYU0_9BACT|nr:carboxypeptidase regulatory-like domain-containing protein [Rufibacter sediminis]MBC3542324.1 carboxypeptidase-like regulatory domain-containing protein [Rufibacter sediminis]
MSAEVQVTYRYQAIPLEQVLQDLEKRYSFNFSYSNNQLPLDAPITCSVTSLPQVKALQALCDCAGLSYQIIGEQIVLKPKTESSTKLIPLRNYTQTLRGTVLDAGLKTPLIGATVQLLSVDPARAVSTGLDGSFALEKLPIGRHYLKVTYLGYKDAEISNIMLVTGKETVVPVQMEESFIQQAEVVVIAERDKTLPQNLLISSSVHTLRAEEINRFAGSRQDPSRMAANYAGVSSASDQRNDLIVRGNSPLGVLWRMEGVEIPNPNHFTFTPNSGGAFSMLNNNLLANSDFLTGAFPAEYGNRIGAVMDVRLREGNNKKVENTLQLGLNGLEVMTEGPLAKKWGGSFLGSMRLFTFRPLEAIGVKIGYNALPSFQDGSFKVVLPTPKAGKFSVWGIAGSSSATIYDIDEDTTTWGKLRYRLEPTLMNQMYAFGIHHTFSRIPKTVTELIISNSGSQVEATSIATYRNKTSRLFYYLRNYERQLITRFNITHKPFHRWLIKGGFAWQKMYYDNQEIMYRDRRDIYEIPLDANGSAALIQGYLLSKVSLSPQLDLQAGVYTQQFTIGNRVAVEPRLSLDYQLTEAQKLYFSAGLLSQTQPLVYYEYRFFSQVKPEFNQPYNRLDFTRSRQVVLGYHRTLSANWRLKAETYYQYHYKVPVSKTAKEAAFSMLNLGVDYSFVTVDSVVSEGTGRNYGLELTAERFLKNGFYALGNLSLLRSHFTGGDGHVRPTAFNIGFISNVLVGKEIPLDNANRHHLSIDLRVNYTGGRRIIPIDEEKTINEQTDEIYYDLKNAYQFRLKNYFRTDIRFSYQINNRKTNHWIFAAADNFLDNKNELYYGWDLEENRAKTYYQLGIYPYLGYRIQF